MYKELISFICHAKVENVEICYSFFHYFRRLIKEHHSDWKKNSMHNYSNINILRDIIFGYYFFEGYLRHIGSFGRNVYKKKNRLNLGTHRVFVRSVYLSPDTL